jgi:hypothetical protein
MDETSFEEETNKYHIRARLSRAARDEANFGDSQLNHLIGLKNNPP